MNEKTEKTKESRPESTHQERLPANGGSERQSASGHERQSQERQALEAARVSQVRVTQAMNGVTEALAPLTLDEQRRVLSSVAALYGISSQRPQQRSPQQNRNGGR